MGRNGTTIEKLEDTIKEPNHNTHKFFFQISIARQPPDLMSGLDCKKNVCTGY
jgi:hypothetical protein